MEDVKFKLGLEGIGGNSPAEKETKSIPGSGNTKHKGLGFQKSRCGVPKLQVGPHGRTESAGGKVVSDRPQAAWAFWEGSALLFFVEVEYLPA